MGSIKPKLERENTPKSPLDVLDNLKNRYKDNPEILREIMLHIDVSNDSKFFKSLQAFLCDREDAHIIDKIFNSTIEGISVEMDLYKRAEQSIIKEVDRPVFLINNDQIDISRITKWNNQIEQNVETISKAIRSVGRIEIKGDDVNFIGTGWLIKNTNIIVTNRHVADEFAARKEGEFLFRQDWLGDTYSVRIDFKKEHSSNAEYEFSVKEIVYLAKQRDLDIALLRIDNENFKGDGLPEGLELSHAIPNLQDEIYVIGFPACNGIKNKTLRDKYFNGIIGKKQFAPGTFCKTGTSKYIYRHDCTTWGGNSGSPVIDFSSGKVLGIHYAGINENYGGYRANFSVSVLALVEILEELNIRYDY
ncbi:serine protease [uncultured Tenacibaculum sp.]|uniref:S1 family peptidase n=1 Tax=uncultured Tenacibaculum sp. TaxID=174713 RepID=UPI002618503D|nr:serine protease [uncultured Tenacibaculum sp.]